MKNIFTTLLVFCCASAMACSLHQFKVPLNQRGFYNPASLCPYCEGSVFLATGAFAGTRTNDFGMFISLGHDGANVLHGAWDFTYSRSSGSDNATTAFGGRYAWRQQMDTWAWAAGMRASYITYTQLLTSPEQVVSVATRNCVNFDAGFMITNQKGFYAGVSTLNITQPTLEMKFELPGGSQL